MLSGKFSGDILQGHIINVSIFVGVGVTLLRIEIMQLSEASEIMLA